MSSNTLSARLVAALHALPALAWHCVRAWRTLEPGDWSRVADEMELLAACLPRLGRFKLLHARVLRAARRSDDAISACRRAVAIRPHDPACQLELGRALRQAGKRDAAIAALVNAARIGAEEARQDLCRYAARAALPVREAGIFARSGYAAYAAENPPPRPPETASCALFRITLTDTTNAAATLASLGTQTYQAWHLADHEPSAAWGNLTAYDLELPAGAELHPYCLAWLNRAIALTGCAVVRADHDHRLRNGERCNPVFLPPAADLLWTEGEGSIVRLAAGRSGIGGRTCHVPLVLLTLPFDPAPAPRILPDAEPRPISVVIPTRDNPALLDAAISSLRQAAARPDRIELVIVDNDSRGPVTLELLERLGSEAGVRIVPFSEPFNWSRASNIGAAAASGGALLFLNDDTVMQTRGWDRILAGLLERPEVGLVGARMVYPDGSIQHGGFVLGMDNGPQHEGRWMPGHDAGPGARWTAIRQAAGVTGAFMAIRAADFSAVGRFDERTFAIDFADLDLCLRVRAAGKAVAYCGAISLIHHESVSRGLNIGRIKRRRMRDEWQRFHKRWKAGATFDQMYHPAWSRTGASYDGLLGLASKDVDRWIIGAAPSG